MVNLRTPHHRPIIPSDVGVNFRILADKVRRSMNLVKFNLFLILLRMRDAEVAI